MSQVPTQTVGIETISADIEENDVCLRLNLIDTPGFGDFVNNENTCCLLYTSPSPRD